MKTTYYTPKTLEAETRLLASQKAISKARTIWKLASKDWQMKRVGSKRMELAKRLYNAIKTEWRYKDLAMNYDTESTQRIARHYDKLDDKQITKITKLCKSLGLVAQFSTWAHASLKQGGDYII